MKFTLPLLAILGLSATSSAAELTVDDQVIQDLWSAWKNSHAKDYTEEEDAHRLNIFTQNYNKILAHNNAKNSTVTLALNHFADLTGDEFKSMHTGGHVPHHKSEADQDPKVEDKRFLGSTSIPASFDWRKKGAVGPVKNQKVCKACWSFAASGSLEALHYIKTGSLESFSEQQFIDCDKSNHACSSGNMLRALSYAASNGIEHESTYPYVAKSGSCRYNSNSATRVNKGYTTVRSNDAQALMAAIVNQPVLVAVEANQSVFQFYHSGVITSGCGASTDHAVLAVGYTTINGQKAFIVKNQYGTGWGQNGYVYISANGSANGGKGVCGILSYAGYPHA